MYDNHFQNFYQAEFIFIAQIVILFVYTYLILFYKRLCQHIELCHTVETSV